MADPMEQVVRKVYSDFAKGDLAGIYQSCDPGIICRFPGKNQLAGNYTWPEFTSKFVPRFMELSEGTFREEVVDVLLGPDQAAVLLNQQVERNEKLFKFATIHVWKIKNGKFYEFIEYVRDFHAYEEAWS